MRGFTIAAVLCSIAASATAMAITPYSANLTPRDDDPCVLADSPALNASMQLANWAVCATNSFFPHPENTNWPQGFTNSYSQDVIYTFNNTHYLYDNIYKLYLSFNATIGAAFAPFQHGVTTKLAIPNDNGDKGGEAYLMGWEGGYLVPAKTNVWYANAVFLRVAEIGGQRKVVELRESSNIPNYAPEPPADAWGC